jgi:hypothetical protein
MSEFPIEPESRPLTIEELLKRARDGLAAEEDLLTRYLNIYAPGSPEISGLAAVYGKRANRQGVDLADIALRRLHARISRAKRRAAEMATRESIEEWIDAEVRRALRIRKKSGVRQPLDSNGDPQEQSEKGYVPESLGDVHSSLVFHTYDDRLESAINKVERKNPDRRLLHQVLARLHIVRGWEFKTLAGLVYGGGYSDAQLEKMADRIRHWVKEASQDIRKKKPKPPGPRAVKDLPGDDLNGLDGDGGLGQDNADPETKGDDDSDQDRDGHGKDKKQP